MTKKEAPQPNLKAIEAEINKNPALLSQFLKAPSAFLKTRGVAMDAANAKTLEATVKSLGSGGGKAGSVEMEVKLSIKKKQIDVAAGKVQGGL